MAFDDKGNPIGGPPSKKEDDSSGGGTNDGLRTSKPDRAIQDFFRTATAGMVPVNIGKGADGFSSMGLESEGFASKPIMANGGLLPNAQGGPFAKLLSDIALKNLLDIKDQTAGIEKLAWIDVPIQSLGGLSPSAPGGAAQGMEYGLG